MNTDKITKNLPPIFAGMGMAFGVIATAEGIKGTLDMCEDGYGKSYFADKDISLKEKAKVIAEYHWPTAVAAIAAAGCIMGSVKGYSSQVAMAGVASYWKKYAQERRAKTREIYGEEGDQNIERAVIHDHISQNPPPKYKRDPNALVWYDPITDQYFEATPGEIEFAEQAMDRILSKACPVQYWYLLKHFRGVKWDMPQCNDIGWFLDDTYADYHYYNESFFGHIQFQILRDEFEDTQYGRVYILRCNLEPMLNVDVDLGITKDSQELHCL